MNNRGCFFDSPFACLFDYFASLFGPLDSPFTGFSLHQQPFSLPLQLLSKLFLETTF